MWKGLITVGSATKSARNLNAPDLVKEWKKTVNQNVMMGRDAKMFKEYLEWMTPVQILYGILQYSNTPTISIPQFLRQYEDWYIEDNIEAEIELAVSISHSYPPAYWIWHDCKDEQDYNNFQAASVARDELKEWADRILT